MATYSHEWHGIRWERAKVSLWAQRGHGWAGHELGTYGLGRMWLVEDGEGGDRCMNTFGVEVPDVTGPEGTTQQRLAQ